MTDPVPTPLRADAQRNRERLLDAAKELFAEQGLDVTLDDVARHAGVGTGTAYRRFPNKSVLIDALMAERLEAMAAIAAECLEDPDPWRGFSGYFERALELQVAHRGLKDVLFSAGRGGEAVARARRSLAPTVTKLVKRAIDAGVLRPDLQTADVPTINFMLANVVDLGRDDRPDLHRRYLALVLEGLRARPGQEPLPGPPLTIGQFHAAIERRAR